MKNNKLKSILSIFVVALISIFAVTSCSFFENDNLDIPDSKKTLYTIHQQGTGNIHTLNSLGEQNILVIPVSFSDYRFNTTEKNYKNIQKTFFGEDTDTGWESLSSYYEKSSYNKLKLNGFVTDWYDVGIKSTELTSHSTNNSSYKNSGENGTWWLLNNAVEWFKKNYDSNDYGDMNFDQDGDGFYDLVWLVYNVPHYTTTNKVDSTFWAFTFWNAENYGYRSKSNPVGYTYCFASYDFMYEGYGNNSLDAHTYIHETGHALGANDYYDTNSDCYPLGCIDMMDFNIGDHCAYTKYSMGWVTPKYIVKNQNETTTYTLNSTNDTGEFILIADSFNNTPFDEYFLIELITPTGLNSKDYLATYPGNNLRGYSVSGVRITHIDARALSYKTNLYTNDFNYMYKVAVDNSNTDTVITGSITNNPYKEITLMQANLNNSYLTKNNCLTSSFEPSNSCLFHEGDTFSLKSGSKYNKLMPSESKILNKGGFFNYSIYINKLSATSLTLTISKI